MTSLVELSPVVSGLDFPSEHRDSHYNNNKRRHKGVLKSKQNTLKLKCNRALKRKLKKYKLRQDGQEDQDILDMSDVLVTSLIIRSPHNTKETANNLNETELLRPKNYLFKMKRNKQVNGTLKENKNSEVVEEQNDNYSNSQEIKQMNAFKLLMDSRNKIIGSNSPGKEKVLDEAIEQEIVENKKIKAKRLLVLQKMAEAKGSLKKKQIDKYKEKCIRVKLKNRAEKFKSMLLNQEIKTFDDDKISCTSRTDNENITLGTTKDNQDCTKGVEKETKSLQLINIFAQSGNSSKNGELFNEEMTKDEKEFLKKLSPSLKKKENMLCYFKKIDKESECSLSSENGNKTIKVKLTMKSKKKGKKRKLVLQKETALDHNDNTEKNPETQISTDADILLSQNRERQKRKRNLKSAPKSNENDTKINKNIEISDNRPKRNIRKPVKYSEELYQTSSEEELHIFTPKKKRHNNSKFSTNVNENKVNLDQNTEILLKSTNLKKKPEQDNPKKKHQKYTHLSKKSQQDTNLTKRPIKLAPIFNNTKQNTDLVAIEAKQKFLLSGVPDQLKKSMSQQKTKSATATYFTTVVHIQQRDISFVNTSTKYSNLFETCLDKEINSTLFEENLFDTLLNHSDCEYKSVEKSSIIKNANDILHYLKEIKPRFPIYRTYRMLRDKRKGEFKGYIYNDLDNSREVINGLMDINIDNPDQLSWSDRYKATSTHQIIGNFESINELKKWLVSWNENQSKARNANYDSDLSDFYHSDTDSGDNLRNGNNLLILTGPVGSGKTSSVYAAAAELAVKVIEVNVSNKRTGKIMLQDLQEATQSHKVNRGASTSDHLQKSQELLNADVLKKVKKRGRPIKSNKLESIVKFEDVSGLSPSQEIIRTDSSLILIDDADVVFDQDDGFSSAIVQLVQSSKRPVILVISTLTCQHLQRFLQNGKIIKMNPLSPKMLGTWLDIMCLADTDLCFPGTGTKFLDYFKGDIRKTINILQFYMSTQSQNLLDEEADSESFNRLHPDNENSNTSWVNSDDSNDNNLVVKNVTSESNSNLIWNFFINRECNLLHFQYPLQRFNIWWSLHSLIYCTNKTDEQTDNKSSSTVELQSIANAIDSISLSDYFNHSNKASIDITCRPWCPLESDNVSEVEDVSFYVRNYETNEEICHDLVKKSIKAAQKTLGIENNYYIDSPGMIIQSERDRIASRHNNLSNYLNPSAVLDRRALALDYWSSCRTLCKIERDKADVQTKRKNRFCHYLKSLNILCNNDSFEHLSDSLCFNKK